MAEDGAERQQIVAGAELLGQLPHQGLGTDPARLFVAGVEGRGRQGQQGLQVPLHPLTNAFGVPSEPGVHPFQAAPLQVGVQRLKALEGRHRHQEVPPHVAHHALHLPLVVALGGTAEPVIEKVVGLKLGEGPGALAPAVPQDPGHRQLGVVVQDALGHPTQEGESGDVAVQESLGGLRRIGFDEAAVAVGQVQDEVVGFALHPADDHQGFAKVALGVPRGMGQRHEHLLRPPPMFPHVVLHDGVLAGEPVLVPQALKDALGGVALLPGNPEVVFQYPVDDAGKGLLLSLSKG